MSFFRKGENVNIFVEEAGLEKHMFLEPSEDHEGRILTHFADKGEILTARIGQEPQTNNLYIVITKKL